MSASNLPTIEYLKQCFRYEDGKLYWLRRPLSHFKNKRGRNIFNGSHIGDEAGSMSKRNGECRWQVRVSGKMLLRSRVVWALCTGSWPNHLVDHINHVTTDDRIDNLREATSRQNNCNSRISIRNTSGFKGVSWHKTIRRWMAYISVDGKSKHLGMFGTAAEAHAAYCDAAKRDYGKFACVE